MIGREFETLGSCDSRPTTVAQALAEGTWILSRLGVETARLDAELLLGMALGWGREQLYLHYGMRLKDCEGHLFQGLLHRRARGEPIAYITGHREFWSHDFLLTPDVLVPRPETELLVEVTLRLLTETEGQVKPQTPEGKIRILDLGTGSGIVAVTLAKERTDVEIWATDLSLGALEVARANAEQHGVQEKIRFVHGDVFKPVEGRDSFFHSVVSNPPYVRRSEIENLPGEVRDWEPKLAWDGGPDGLDLCRRIITQGHRYLKDAGFIAVEIGPDMGEEVCWLFGGTGRYSEISVHRDYSGRDRVVSARKLPTPRALSREA
ncbi:MAG: peptide chain release factor N(5)-glutamine methyltransferase [Candidatus Binatia bacterium]